MKLRNRLILVCILLPILLTKANERQKRQFNFGFGNPNRNTNNNNQDLGHVVDSFLGGLFGHQTPHNHGPNQSSTDHSGHQINPFDVFNQFAGGSGQGASCHINNGGCQHGCRTVRRRPLCYCQEGFTLMNDGRTCGDINECQSRFNKPCQDICKNTNGSFKCSCSRGTLLPDKVSCDASIIHPSTQTPIDPHGHRSCGINNGGCHQKCKHNRRNNGIHCECERGYRLKHDQRTCTDIDECLHARNRCRGLPCINTEGSFQCGSDSGSLTQSCQINRGGCQHRCRQTRFGVRCRCNNGFDLQQDGHRCSKSNTTETSTPSNMNLSCTVNKAGCQQKCKIHNKKGRICSCRKNYTLQADKVSCLANNQQGRHGNPCHNNNGGCEHSCVNNHGSPVCQCNQGFSFASDGHCHSINPCQQNNGGCEQNCVNNQGSPVCQCQQGFQLINGNRCQRLDPCQQNNGGCQQICNSNQGSVVCQCQQGFHLVNGVQCQAMNPCQQNNGGCQQTCVNNQGHPVCQCQQGFQLIDGKLCQRLDPCQQNNGGCQQICSNNQGKVACQCQSGYQLADGTRCRVIQGPTQPPHTPAPPTAQPKSCGVNTKKSLLRRIVGGKPADPKDWPWMAALLRVQGNKQFCGGTLITDRHVLTAAHCIVQFTTSELIVRLGEYNFDTPNENNPTDFRVAEIRKHEQYSPVTQENDIAVLKLNRPSTFSEFIWPACLPPAGNNFETQLGYVTGWGTIHFGGPVSGVLREVVIPVWKQNECVSAYPENVVSNAMMCAGNKAGGKDSCQGDSGGPFLIQIYPQTRWYVAGIVSWGIECASPNRPGVYTRVNHYLDWIKENSVF